MARDVMYIFDKLTKVGSELGEIQTGFNMSFVIDGTKDSCSIVVRNFSDVEVEPYSLVFHEKTLTWWCVAHDKVERTPNENGSFVYVHNLELLGAIEILNARDLTDCGFNDNTYTVHQFISRLFILSNFEYTVDYTNIDSNFKNKKVDFIKTFENYTLLSALREFLDAYNMCPKLTFGYTTYQGQHRIIDAILNIFPKTGNSSVVHEENEFKDVRETKTMDKESFGVSVISNAENVISSSPKTFPSTGSVRLSGTEDNITPSTAVLRLPSKVYKANWLKMHYKLPMLSQCGDTFWATGNVCYPFNDNFIDELADLVYTRIKTEYLDEELAQWFKQDVYDNASVIKDRAQKMATVTFYEGNKLVPYFGANNDQTGKITIEKGDNVPYLARFPYAFGKPKMEMILTTKENRDLLPIKNQGIAWERGSNVLTGFDFLANIIQVGGYSIATQDTDYQEANGIVYERTHNSRTIKVYPGDIDQGWGNFNIDWKTTSFEFNYVPMSDIKIKIDNQRDKKDIQLYNQNGRMTDCVALSKLINSYSKEISSDTITKYMDYYNFTNVPKVGELVMINNQKYVINNVSCTFSPNESNDTSIFAYFIECEVTMSKWISTKSLMVNPNTNIRDYGIPQNFNVKRKQLYRDYYELTYVPYTDSENNNAYLDFETLTNFTHYYSDNRNFIAVIKCSYDEEINGSYDYYYQLETTNYNLDKMLYVVLDFQDNNVIGYGSQNVFSGFVISRILTGLTDVLNTPIGYVDDNGKVKDIYIKFATSDQINDVYQDYKESITGGTDYAYDLDNYSVFITSYIYDNIVSSLEIEEEYYRKDALEVPVFEYCCQIDDSDDVIIGDNILRQYKNQTNDNLIYFYDYVIGDNLTQENVVDDNTITETTHPIGWSVSSGFEIIYDTYSDIKLLRINLYNWQRWDIDELGFTNGLSSNVLQYAGKDFAFFRKTFNLTTGKLERNDLMFIAKKVPTTNITLDGGTITLIINHYKLR